MTDFNNIKTVLFLDFSFNMLTVMTEILDTVHLSAQAKELTMLQKPDVCVCLQVEKEREEPTLMDLSETAKHSPSLWTEIISFKWAHQHGFSPFVNEGGIFCLSNTESFSCHH
jgi:hypothetical protein